MMSVAVPVHQFKQLLHVHGLTHTAVLNAARYGASCIIYMPFAQNDITSLKNIH